VEEAKAYIESGILELYVLGQLDAPEQEEVERMATLHPEIRSEMAAIELAMEKYAMEKAVQPKPQLMNKILQQINAGETLAEPEFKEAVVTPLTADPAPKSLKPLQFALAACLALLAMSIFALYTTHSRLSDANQQLIVMRQDREKFAATVNFMKDENKDLQQINQITTDPTWAKVKLAGTQISPKASLMVYWHKEGKHVMLDNASMSLPENDKEHQYQLWAIVQGKPVDLGVFDADSRPKKVLLDMKAVGNAQAFAVTLEKRGGSPGPTMEKMVLISSI